MNLKDMTTEDLTALLNAIKNELSSRSAAVNLVVYTHDCQKSSKSHLTKYKHWTKIVKSVDLTKANGYAFIGDFLSVTAEHKLPADSIVVEVCDKDITAYRVTPSGKAKITEATTHSMSGLIQTVADILA